MKLKIMKKVLFLITFMIGFGAIHATEQVPDILFYKNKKLTLSTGWGHPSPLQTYYSQKNIEYPFSMLSTANYRGHVAIYEIKDDKLFIKKIEVGDKKYKPSEFNVKSERSSINKNEKVFADWFSGVIECQLRNKKNYWKTKSSYYFHVRKGIVVKSQNITNKDYNRIEKITEKDTSDTELMDKYFMLILNQNYIAYYFRLSGNDTIIIGGKGGYLSGNSGLSPLLAYYSNDHMKWPYNWENFEKNGAPNCEWVIEENKIYLTELSLHSGTGFYSIDKEPVDLEILFKDKLVNKRVLGEWISGIYIIRHGEEVEDENLPGYKEFKATEITYLRIINGVVKETYTVPSDFDFRNIPEETESGLKKIFEELKKPKAHNNGS